MSFSDLRKNKNKAFQDLQSQLEKKTTVSTIDERFWKLNVDKAGNGFAVIRFLPTPAAESMPYVQMYSYWFRTDNGVYAENSLTTLGKDDPCGLLNRAYWNSGDADMKKLSSDQRRKTHYYSNIYVVKDPSCPENEGTVRLFKYGKQIHDVIMAAIKGNELEGLPGVNPFDFWNGCDFNLRSKKASTHISYNASTFNAPATLENFDDAQLESVYGRLHPLQPLVAADQFKTFDELKTRLDRVVGFDSSLGVNGPSSVSRPSEPAGDSAPARVIPSKSYNSEPKTIAEDTLTDSIADSDFQSQALSAKAAISEDFPTDVADDEYFKSLLAN